MGHRSPLCAQADIVNQSWNSFPLQLFTTLESEELPQDYVQPLDWKILAISSSGKEQTPQLIHVSLVGQMRQVTHPQNLMAIVRRKNKVLGMKS